MKFSEMKLQATNAVKAYFNRNWTREDMMNYGEIPENAYTSLKTVYLTLFCAMWSFTFGSFLHLIWEAGGPFTVLSSVASLLWLYFTSPLRVWQRVSLLMYAACTLGASFGLFTKYLFEIDQVLIVSLLEGSTLGIGIVWFGSSLTRERRVIYTGCLSFSCALMFSSFVVNALDVLDSHTAHWVLKVYTVQALFMGYIVIYSQEILYDAGLGEINFVDRTLTVFFHLPAIVNQRVSLVMIAAFFFGASVGLFTKYFFEIHQDLVVRLLAGAAFVFGCFWFGAWANKGRSQIYVSALFLTWTLTYLLFDSHTAHWMLKVYLMLALFMGYLVLYSQEILYNGRFGDVNFVNCTFTVFFCLPAIVVHAVRLCMGTKIEQRRQN